MSLHVTWVTWWCSFIGGWSTLNVTDVINFSSGIRWMINLWLIFIYLSKSNNMSSAFSLYFIRWNQWIRISTRFKFNHIWSCNILTVCNIIWNISNSILFQLIRAGLFDVTYFHVVTSFNASYFCIFVGVHLSPLNIIYIKFIVHVASKTPTFLSFALWID